MNPLFHTEFSISDSLKNVRKSVLIYETIINSYESKVNNIVGDFTSINLLAVDFSIQKSFREYVKQIQQQLLTDMEHKFFSGVEVLRELSQGKENIIMPYVFTSGIGVIRNTKKEGYHGKYYQNGISQTPQVFIDCLSLIHI